MTHPRDHILPLSVQLRSDMTTLANVTCKVRVNGGSATTYTNSSTPAITQNSDITYGYQVQIPANTYADGDDVEVTWLYSTTPYAYDALVIGPAAVDGAHYTTGRGDNLANLDAAVSGVAASAATAVWAAGTRSLTTFGTLAADTAAAVWNSLTSGLTTAGSVGKLLVTNIDAPISGISPSAIATAVWASLTSALTTVGSIGKLLVTNIDATISSRATPFLPGTVTVTSPVLSAGRLSLVQGDDYKAADSRALIFTSSDWPSLTGAAISLELRNSPTATPTSYAGTATSATTAQIELAGTQTAVLDGAYRFDVVATLSGGNVVTLTNGICDVAALP